jgi:catechol 2,3-dioxygenase-like lactoylglutathione lyase family enzyme
MLVSASVGKLLSEAVDFNLRLILAKPGQVYENIFTSVTRTHLPQHSGGSLNWIKQMKQKIAQVAIVVEDYDDAIRFYTEKLHFTLVEDTRLSESKRWVKVAPKGATDCCLLLAKAANEEQKSRIGNQTGGRVFLFLHTDDFQRDYKNLLDQQIKIVREPVAESWGMVAVFEDLYGNLWDLVEPAK